MLLNARKHGRVCHNVKRCNFWAMLQTTLPQFLSFSTNAGSPVLPQAFFGLVLETLQRFHHQNKGMRLTPGTVKFVFRQMMLRDKPAIAPVTPSIRCHPLFYFPCPGPFYKIPMQEDGQPLRHVKESGEE
eukprot:1147965-Pelagomonas_calceolata.AAC.1